MITYLIQIALVAIVGDNPVMSPDSMPTAEHAFYVSVIRLEHESGSRTGTAEFTIFSDDLESGLRADSGSRDCTISDLCDCSEQIQQYLTSHTKLEVNNTERVLSNQSCERIGDTHRILFSFESPEQWTSVDLESSFLMELFPTQNHMVYVHAGNVKTTSRLTAKKPDVTINVN